MAKTYSVDKLNGEFIYIPHLNMYTKKIGRYLLCVWLYGESGFNVRIRQLVDAEIRYHCEACDPCGRFIENSAEEAAYLNFAFRKYRPEDLPLYGFQIYMHTLIDAMNHLELIAEKEQLISKTGAKNV